MPSAHYADLSLSAQAMLVFYANLRINPAEGLVIYVAPKNPDVRIAFVAPSGTTRTQAGMTLLDRAAPELSARLWFQ